MITFRRAAKSANVRAVLATVAAAILTAGSLTGCSSSENELAEPTQTAAPSTSTTATTTTSAEKTETSSAQSQPVCDDALLQDDFPDMRFSECEGGYAFIGVPHTDHTAIVHWTGSRWEPLPTQGEAYSALHGMTGCYDRAKAKELGIPAAIQKRMFFCDQDESTLVPGGNQGSQNQASQQNQAQPANPAPQGGATYFQNGIILSAGLGEAGEDASYPACDGRTILILDSVIDQGNDGGAMNDIARQVLIQHPSGQPVRFTVPGQCPSLRAQVDGNNVYPIYIDYGTNTSAACQAKVTYGGNARVLSNRAEFVDPC